jgi:hypothetical protein
LFREKGGQREEGRKGNLTRPKIRIRMIKKEGRLEILKGKAEGTASFRNRPPKLHPTSSLPPCKYADVLK